MNTPVYDVVIVGGGFSGLAASYYLKQSGIDHIIFERNRIGESWRSQRWDSFRLNSTNKLNLLPGMICESDEDAFDTATSLVKSFEQYVLVNQLPVSENSRVTAVEKRADYFYVTVSVNGEMRIYKSKQVLIASGAFNEIRIPDLAEDIPGNIKQLHASQYRNSDRLPDGAILVVGSAQSGIQIAFDLIESGREVYLSTSEVGRVPRWYRGRDIFYWFYDSKFYDITEAQVTDPKALHAKPPQITGAGTGRNTISLQAFAKKGGIILGRLSNAGDNVLTFEPDAKKHVQFADKVSAEIKTMIDEYILQNHIDAPSPHLDEADIADTTGSCASDITSINLKEKNINTIIWATGFMADLGYIKLPVFNPEGKLIHQNGIPEIQGLHFLGYPWLFSKKSTILFGIAEDVKIVISNVCKNAGIKDQISPAII